VDRHIRADAPADIQGLKFGPDATALPDTLSVVISAFGPAMHAGFVLFGIKQFQPSLGQCIASWKALGMPSQYKCKAG
jgi:hypothetical protein